MLRGYISSTEGSQLSVQIVLGAARNVEEIGSLVLQNLVNVNVSVHFHPVPRCSDAA